MLYLLLQALGLPQRLAFVLGFVTVVGLRLGTVFGGWQLPTFHLPA